MWSISPEVFLSETRLSVAIRQKTRATLAPVNVIVLYSDFPPSIRLIRYLLIRQNPQGSGLEDSGN